MHFLFEVLGYFAGITTYAVLRARRGDALSDESRATILAGAALGAMIGSRLLHWLCDPHLDLFSLIEGKTILGGLLGGLIGVELAKKKIGIERSTGDLLVAPLIIAIAIGRIGCFLTGPADHTAGLPTNLPWGIAIGDGVPRHPVALYEIAFLLLLLPLTRLARREGDAFRIFLSSYLLFRLFVDFLKPDPRAIFGGLTSLQWACVAGLLYYGALQFIPSAARDQRSRLRGSALERNSSG